MPVLLMPLTRLHGRSGFELNLKMIRSKDRDVMYFEGKKGTFMYSEMRKCKASLRTSEQIQLYNVVFNCIITLQIKEVGTKIGS